MSSAVHHPLLSVAPASLRPTQLTVGKAEVAAKRAEWEKPGARKRRELLKAHCFPGVPGPQRTVPLAHGREAVYLPGWSGAIG